jgi:hypothetical protein
MPPEERSKTTLRRRAEAERDAELDQVLRELGNDVLQQEIPDRLLRLLRAAAEAARGEAKLGDEAERPRERPDAKPVSTRGK